MVSRQRFHHLAAPPASGSTISSRSPPNGAFDQPCQRLFPCGVWKLVEREGRKNRRATLRQTHGPDIALSRRGRNAKCAIGFGCFSHRPRVDVDAHDAWRRRQSGSPRRTSRARAAPEIDEGGNTVGRVRKRADDPSDEQMVEGPIEQGERRTFPSARERGSLDQLLAAFNVRGRQRAQRARHLGKRQIAEVFRFERGEP